MALEISFSYSLIPSLKLKTVMNILMYIYCMQKNVKYIDFGCATEYFASHFEKCFSNLVNNSFWTNTIFANCYSRIFLKGVLSNQYFFLGDYFWYFSLCIKIWGFSLLNQYVFPKNEKRLCIKSNSGKCDDLNVLEIMQI